MARKPMKHADLKKKFEAHAIKALTGQSDLACALIATAFVENALMTLLANFFVGCSTAEGLFKGILGDMAKCADMAYCLGFINKGMLISTKKVGDIRNIFAHSSEHLDFNHPSIKQILATINPPFLKISMTESEKANSESFFNNSPRWKFSYIAVALYGVIMVAADSVERRKERGDDDSWPS